MRADSAVEPTRSENITVTWRRSAVSWGFGSVVGAWSMPLAWQPYWRSRERGQAFSASAEPERNAEAFRS